MKQKLKGYPLRAPVDVLEALTKEAANDGGRSLNSLLIAILTKHVGGAKNEQ